MYGWNPPSASWRKSSRSGGGNNCVEVALARIRIAVRDSKNQAGSALVFTRGQWLGFVGGVHAGRFDQS